MTEHIGMLFKAGEETAKSGKDVFKVGIREGDKDWEYTLFDTAHIKVAKENKGKAVKVVAEKGDSGFWNVKSIEPATDEAVAKAAESANHNGRHYGRSPEERQEIAVQVAVKSVTDLWVADKLNDKDPEVVALRVWLQEHLSAKEAPLEKPKKPVKVKEQPEKEATRTQRLNAQAVRLWTIDSTKEGAAGVKAFGEWFQKEANGIAWDDLTDEAQENIIKALKKKADKEGKLVPSEEPF